MVCARGTQWYNLQWSKAENNPGWPIGYSSSARANTSTACPGQVNFCSAASAGGVNNTVTKASQAVGLAVANALLAARLNDGTAAWTPLSFSLNAPQDDATNAPVAAPGAYQPTVSNNFAAATAAPATFVAPANLSGDNPTGRFAGALRQKAYADSYLNFAPYGKSTVPGVRPYNLAPQFARAAGFVVNPRASSYQNTVAAFLTNSSNPSWAAIQNLTRAGAAAATATPTTDAQKQAFNWRLGGAHAHAACLCWAGWLADARAAPQPARTGCRATSTPSRRSC